MFAAHFADCRGSLVCTCESKRYSLALIVVIFTCLFEAIGGYLTNSVSLLSDAIHLFSDGCDLGIGLVVAQLIHSSRTNERKLRAKGGIASFCLIVGIVGFLIWESVPRLFYPEPVASLPMIGVAIGGFAGNLLQLAIIEAGDEDHLTQRSLGLHFLMDTLLSLAVIVGGVAVWCGFPIVDPIISLLGASLIFRRSLGLLRDCLQDLSP